MRVTMAYPPFSKRSRVKFQLAFNNAGTSTRCHVSAETLVASERFLVTKKDDRR